VPQDLFQIALEHHRCGRLRLAESGYRALLAIDAENPDANHWLGVLFLQAGQIDQAVPLLERATEARPNDAAFWHNLGHAYMRSRRMDDALKSFDRAIAVDPAQPAPLFSAATVRLGRQSNGDINAAIELLGRAKAAGWHPAELHQTLGIALMLAGKVDQAIPEFHAALDLKPNSADAYHHLGAAHLQRKDMEGARWCLERAMELEPHNPRAVFGLASIELQEQNLERAEDLFRKAIDLQPQAPAAYQGLATVLERTGRKKEAKAALADAQKAAHGLIRPAANSMEKTSSVAELERKLTRTPEAEKLHFQVARNSSVMPPPRHPTSAVSSLFNRYADQFDEHLVGKLDYHVPERIGETIKSINPAHPLDILDLGCGTGLCGVMLKPMAGRLVGVDLSPNMVAKARQRGVYDEVIEGDLVAIMHQHAESFDLLVSADVLNYLGDLSLVLGAATGTLRPGGRFIFSIEAGEGDGYAMDRKHNRYSHGKPYIERLAAMHGFVHEAFDAITVRTEAGRPVEGFLVLLRYQP